MGRNDVIFAARLPSELLTRAQKASKERGIPVSQLVREGLEMALATPSTTSRSCGASWEVVRR